MSRHTDSAATTLYAADMAWTAALYVYAVRCDVCGRAVAYPRDTPERAEIATRWRATREGWRIETDAVERIARASLAMGAPVQLVAAVCVLESGASPARTPAWCGALHVGAGVEAQPRVAARSIARALRRCGGRTTARRWTRALASYRWGRCDAADPTGYVARGVRLALAIGGAS